jgi:hypothetical protein
MKTPVSRTGAILCATLCAIHVNWNEQPSQDATSERVQHARAALHFEENVGQADPHARYIARAGELNLLATDDRAVIVFADGSSMPPFVSLELIGSRHSMPIGRHTLRGTANYFRGSDRAAWLTNLPTYSELWYSDVYRGIDWVFHGNLTQSRLEYDFVLAPGADSEEIAVRIAGAASIEIKDGKHLALEVAGRSLYMNELFVYQTIKGERVEVDAHYAMKGQDTIGFVIDGAFDRTRPLVIDPVLAYSTYIGGSNTDRGFAPAIDHHGQLYLTGTTASLNFPVESPEQATNGGNFDAYVAKFSADGSELEYSTYFGGSRLEEGFGIAVDEHGSAYVSGRTGSPDMPVVNALQPVYGGGPFDAFVMKLDPSGSELLFSTFVGGIGDDRAFDLRLDARDRLFVSGTTGSTNFPIVNGLQPIYAGNTDAFLSTMSDDGSALLYSTYLGGSGMEQFGALAVDNAGRAAVVGRTSSLDFPVANAVQPIFGGGPADAFVSRYNEFGSDYIYSSYLGGSGDDSGISTAVTRAGEVFVGGNTTSLNYPVVNALQPMFAGVRDMIITRLDRSGQIVFSTYLGGRGNENAFGLAVDAPGNLYLSGFTNSPDFPTKNALYATPRGGVDAVFAKISRAGDSLIYSTYFGGTGEDRGDYIALDPAGNAYFCGWTGSLDFPTTPGAFQPTFGGPQFDAFVVKFADDRPTRH